MIPLMGNIKSIMETELGLCTHVRRVLFISACPDHP